MTSIFASWTLGAALLYSAIKNMSLIELLKGESGPGQPESIVDAVFARAGNSSTGTEGAEPMSGQGIKPKGKLTRKMLNGHPGGLMPGITAVAATVLTKFPGLSITATTDGTHATDSYHYKKRAVDISGSPQEMHQAAAWIGKHLTHVLVEGIHNPNLSVKNHKAVSASFWGSETWAAHANHIHLAV